MTIIVNNSRSNTTMGRLGLLCSWALLLSMFSGAGGQETGRQEIGSEICSCAPNTYEFTLDFSLFCPPVNITIGDAIAATTCMVSPFGDPEVTDLIPVAVQSIDILELNQNLQIMMQENIAGNFGDGDTFQYTSYAALPGEVVNPEDLPRAIQINIIGVNEAEEPIINVYLITFTNSCGTYPVLFEGQSAGWTRFSDLGPPDREFCPLVPVPETPAPSPEPSPEPSPAPVVDPTPPPTSIPTQIPMSMSFSMSMDLRFVKLFDSMNDIEDMAKEFGREPLVMNQVGIRGSRVPLRPRASGATQRVRNKDSTGMDSSAVEDAECDDLPCNSVSNFAEKMKGAKSSKMEKPGKEMKLGKADKGPSKDGKNDKGAKSGKNSKKDKTHTKKDSNKLTKSSDRRLASSVDVDGETLTYEVRR